MTRLIKLNPRSSIVYFPSEQDKHYANNLKLSIFDINEDKKLPYKAKTVHWKSSKLSTGWKSFFLVQTFADDNIFYILSTMTIKF